MSRLCGRRGRVLSLPSSGFRSSAARKKFKRNPAIGRVKEKEKKTIKENLFGKTEAFKSLLTKASSSLGTPPCLPQVDCTTSSLRIKEDDSKDSSSDDGIEEAIQRFQQEEKERHEGLRCFQLKEVLDSSSDDGIEEAIRNYQQERQKEREHTVHPKQSCLMAVSIGVKPLKKTAKKKNRKKNTVEPKEMKCASPKPDDLSVGMLPAGCVEASGESLCSSKSEMPQEARAIHSTLTVNTTAELMCAEAILDISKTVMPAAFEPSLDLANNSTTGTASFLSTGVSLQQNKKSDESSVDSEDGIEQEIRKFLELKAKLHEQTSTTNQPEVSTVPKAPQHIKVEENQNKTLRLSFSRKRKRHLEESKIGKQGISGNTLKEEPQPKPLSQSLGTSPPKSFHCSDKNYSSDKSSSLDSDEDLDAAIKDLLKTKKRVKKKVRDMKLKARKSCKPIQLTCTDTLKKHRPVKNQKLVLAHKPVKPGVAKISKGLKHSKKPKLSAKEGQGSGYQLAVQGVQSTPVDEESSSVDSDDSIEQEIRRFLAEKAKGSSTSLATLKQDNARGAEDGAFSTFEEKYVSELQTKPSDLEGALISIDPKQEVQMQNIGMNVKEPDSSFASCYSLEEKRMNDQLQERTLQECRKISMETGRDCAQKVTGNQTYSDTFVVNVTDPQQRKNLFLMKHDNCGISTAREKPSADLSNNFQNRSNIPLIEAISTVSPSPSQTRKHCLCSSSESLIVAKKETDESSRSDSFDLYRDRKGLWDQPPKPTRHASSNHAHLSQHLPPYPSHLSCVPLPLALSQPRASASLVHLRRDQASVVALSGHKSTHLQLKNTQKDTRITSEDRAEELEKCIDETDVESGEEKTDRRQQQCSQ
ncbi:Protein phosphatase 1 regulatory subunit 26 [Bagarius yarrelli]|uniref:Protein phosphatase 1 regulatory subunit 26 n=1 Tax=Bagarius yarrelli TaxID=175774 RepID=A0A556TU34_BAGYA|nr:Protein phosphatase 1 regulatory subunit 26 [Bagarius yarrelli]